MPERHGRRTQGVVHGRAIVPRNLAQQGRVSAPCPCERTALQHCPTTVSRLQMGLTRHDKPQSGKIFGYPEYSTLHIACTQGRDPWKAMARDLRRSLFVQAYAVFSYFFMPFWLELFP